MNMLCPFGAPFLANCPFPCMFFTSVSDGQYFRYASSITAMESCIRFFSWWWNSSEVDIPLSKEFPHAALVGFWFFRQLFSFALAYIPACKWNLLSKSWATTSFHVVFYVRWCRKFRQPVVYLILTCHIFYTKPHWKVPSNTERSSNSLHFEFCSYSNSVSKMVATFIARSVVLNFYFLGGAVQE